MRDHFQHQPEALRKVNDLFGDYGGESELEEAMEKTFMSATIAIKKPGT